MFSDGHALRKNRPFANSATLYTSSFLHTNIFSDTKNRNTIRCHYFAVNSNTSMNIYTIRFVPTHLRYKLTYATHCHLLALRLCTRLLAEYTNGQDHHHHHPHKSIISTVVIHLMNADDAEEEEGDFCKFDHLGYTTKLHTYTGIFLSYAFTFDNMQREIILMLIIIIYFG